MQTVWNSFIIIWSLNSGIETDLRGADTDMTVQEIISDFKFVASTVENILWSKQQRRLFVKPQTGRSHRCDVRSLPWETETSSTPASSGSVKSSDCCCPQPLWHRLPRSGTCDPATMSWRSWSSLKCSFPLFADACGQAKPFTHVTKMLPFKRLNPEYYSISPVFLKRLTNVDIWHHISINKQKVRTHKGLCINIPEHVS